MVNNVTTSIFLVTVVRWCGFLEFEQNNTCTQIKNSGDGQHDNRDSGEQPGEQDQPNDKQAQEKREGHPRDNGFKTTV